MSRGRHKRLLVPEAETRLLNVSSGGHPSARFERIQEPQAQFICDVGCATGSFLDPFRFVLIAVAGWTSGRESSLVHYSTL
jgi:hypothetical protein